MTQTTAPMPEIVDQAEWEAAQARMLEAEKALTRHRDEVAALHRRMPMVEVTKQYVFTGPDGPASLVDLFQGRRQLVLYHFMFPEGEATPCTGCSMFVDQLGHVAHLNARDTSRVLVSRAPLPELEDYRERMGWSERWYSSDGTDFNEDFGVTIDGRETFGLSILLRDGDRVFRCFTTQGRGVEALGPVWTILDLTPFGRQETWEDSPDGWPQTPPYMWWRRHAEYEHGMIRHSG